MDVLRRVLNELVRLDLLLITYFLPIPILVFYIMALTGCMSTSPGLPEIYTLKLRSWPNATISEINLGYFALCFTSHVGLQCGTTTGLSAEALVGKFNLLGNDTTAALRSAQIFSWALSLQRLNPPLLCVAFALFVVGLLFLWQLKRKHWRMKRKGRRGTPSSTYTLMIHCASAAFGLAAAVEVQLTTAALEFASNTVAPSSITFQAGNVLVVFQWLAFGFSVGFVAGLYLLVRRGEAVQAKEERGATPEDERAREHDPLDPRDNHDPVAEGG